MINTYKQQWVDALRSGEYNEGVHPFYLRTKDNRFSVFGVLCDVLDSIWENINTVEYYYFGGYAICLPEGIQKEAKLSDANIDTIDKMQIDGLRFTDIADYIEEFIPGEC